MRFISCLIFLQILLLPRDIFLVFLVLPLKHSSNSKWGHFSPKTKTKCRMLLRDFTVSFYCDSSNVSSNSAASLQRWATTIRKKQLQPIILWVSSTRDFLQIFSRSYTLFLKTLWLPWMNVVTTWFVTRTKWWLKNKKERLETKFSYLRVKGSVMF